MDVNIKDQILNLNLLVVKNLPYDIILGADMLAKYKTEINWELKFIKINSKKISFDDISGTNDVTISNLNINNPQREQSVYENYGSCNSRKGSHELNSSVNNKIAKMVIHCPKLYAEEV